MDRKPEAKMPSLLLLRCNPFEPTSNSILFWELISSITFNDIDCFASSVNLNFRSNNFLDSFFLAIRFGFGVTCQSVFNNLGWFAQERANSKFEDWPGELSIESRIDIEVITTENKPKEGWGIDCD
jgi:hypothetical protein